VAVPFNDIQIQHFTLDEAGNSCTVITAETAAPVSGTKSPAALATLGITVGTTTSFDPTTGSGTESFAGYHGGRCIGAAFDSTGATQTSTGTRSFVVSNSGNRIETIITGYSELASAFSVAGSVKGFVFSRTGIRQRPQD
jgi:hypothetical protein